MIDYDEPTSWATKELHTPPEFNVAAYQQKINAITGLAPNGTPNVRLVWAPDISKCYSKFYVSWLASGHGLVGEMRAKYKYAVINIPGTSDYVDIPPPRWILEDREDPARYMASWEQARWSKDGKELRPAAPTEGYYSHILTIATHDANCCKGAKRSKVVCWGKFRHPDQTDLDILRRAKYLRDKDAEIPLDQPLSEKTLASAAREGNERIAQRKAMESQKMKDFIDENALELIEVFTGVKGDTSKFSIPPGMKKEKGLIVPAK